MNDFEHDLMSHYHLGDFRNYSKERLRAIALCAEVGLPLYKIRHSSAVADTAVVIAREVKAQLRISVDEEICELGGMLHDIGISQILTDDMPEHGPIGAKLHWMLAFRRILPLV